VTIFSVVPRGVGRVDYSSAVAIAVESAISIWQQNFTFQDVVTILPGEFLDIEVPIEKGKVAVIGDYFASIPSNHLIRLEVVLRRPAPQPPFTVYEWADYQQIQVHLKKPNFWTGELWLRAHNYRDIVQTDMLVGCSGYLANQEAYTQRLEVQQA